MIQFLNDDVRKEFHLLPIDRQQELLSLADLAAKRGQVITVLYAEGSKKTSEITIRIDAEFDHSA